MQTVNAVMYSRWAGIGIFQVYDDALVHVVEGDTIDVIGHSVMQVKAIEPMSQYTLLVARYAPATHIEAEGE